MEIASRLWVEPMSDRHKTKRIALLTERAPSDQAPAQTKEQLIGRPGLAKAQTRALSAGHTSNSYCLEVKPPFNP